MTIRLGIIGTGIMGSAHATYLTQSAIKNATLTALADPGPASLSSAAQKFPGIPTFTSHLDLLRSKTCDAILIATPHYHHVPIALDAFAHNTPVLCEKPLAVTTSEARRLIDTHQQKYPHLLFGIMYNQRANPLYQKIRELISTGQLGPISRITWIITNWFRTNAYYKLSPWRATWAGEGGGVLINQCPHNLDLLSWTTGLHPTRITAVGSLGKHHPIETEDEISAILEYPATKEGPGAVGHFITTTAEYPGTNRLEIAGSRAKIVAENNTVQITRNAQDSIQVNRTSPEPFATPPTTTETLSFPPPTHPQSEHQAITQNFVDTLLSNSPTPSLLAPGPEALHGLQLGNAILLSALQQKPIPLPLDAAAYDSFLLSMTQVP